MIIANIQNQNFNFIEELMNLLISFVLAVLVIVHGQQMNDDSRSLRRVRKPGPVRGCKTTPKCKAIGGVPSIEKICKRYPGFNFIQHDDGSYGEGVVKKDKCGCCFKEDKEKAISAARVASEYFQLQSFYLGSKSGEFEDSTTRISFHLETDDSGLMVIKSSQMMIDDGSTVWGFTPVPGGKPQVVDCDGSHCIATIPGYVSSALAEAIAPGEQVDDGLQVGRLVDAMAQLTFTDPSANKALGKFKDEKNIEDAHDTSGQMIVVLKINPDSKLVQLGMKSLLLKVDLLVMSRWRWIPSEFIVIQPPILLYENKKNLCIQPVRVRQRNCGFEIFGICFSPSYTYSGAGLAFGKPGANEQWAKADITFTWKEWKTINDNAGKYKSLTTGETGDLRSEITDDPCCIEIFFVEAWNPSDTYGGGATWSSGTANAQIISSDEMVACGVDKVHLAHEIGHALGLMHPGTGSATLADGSTGTLACPSGWERDNPRRNSLDNKNNVVNPLLTNYMALWTAFTVPDCTSSADCGSCNAHIPADAC